MVEGRQSKRYAEADSERASSRSARPELARPVAGELTRQRLTDLLADRWRVPVLFVVAPGGFGKSTAVAQAIVDNDLDPSGIDVYRAYRPGLDTPARFATGIGRSVERLSVKPEPAQATPVDPVQFIVDAIDRQAPQHVCVHIDGADLLAAEGLDATLAELVDRLPGNGHVVLIGRRTAIELPAAAQALGAAELAFTSPELAALAAAAAADPAALNKYQGWPALTRLAVVAGDEAALQFVVEEVLSAMTGPERRAIATAAMAGDIDAGLAEVVGLSRSVADLVSHLPLVERRADGSVSVAPLWSDVLDSIVDGAEQQELAALVTPRLADAGRNGDAIACAANAGLWSQARSFVMSAAAGGDPGITATETERWLGLFPNDQLSEPELVFLRGLHARLLYGPGSGKDDIAAALAVFDDRKMLTAASVAAVELGVQAWLTGDVALITKIMAREQSHESASRPDLRALFRLGSAVKSEMGGDYVAASEIVADIDCTNFPITLAELVLRYSTGAAFRIGDSARGTKRAAELLAVSDSPSNRFLVAVTSFEHGDPHELGRWRSIRYPTGGNRRDDFWAAAWSCLIDGAFGFEPRVDLVERLAWDRTRERCYVAAARAVAAIIEGSEQTAAGRMQELVDSVGFVDATSEAELRRFLLYAYVLVPDVRSHFDDRNLDPPLGPLHVRRLALANLFVALRNGDEPDWSGYEGPEVTFCALPLPWALELACLLFERDNAAGDELGGYLLAAGGQRAQRVLRELASGAMGPNEETAPLAVAAGTLLAAIPTPPAEVSHLQLCGPLLVLRGETAIQHPRTRVRQLLALLVLRRSLSRSEAARLLWPSMDPVKAGQNLRVTLSALRRLLEPDRRRGERSFHLRDAGDSLVFEPNEMLTCDVWQIEDLLDTAAEFEGSDRDPSSPPGPSGAGHDAVLQAVALWSGPILAELDDVTETRGTVDRLRTRLASAAVATAERMVRTGQATPARALAERVVEDDPYNEAARAVVVASFIDEEDYAAAGRAIDMLLTALAELNVEPSDLTRMLIKRVEHRSASRS